MQDVTYTIVEVDESSEWLAMVQQLGDSQRNTIGFMPTQAFEDYARKHCILAVISDSDLIGYVMYRYKRTAIIIVHLCVSPQHRRCGYAKKLIDALLDKEAAYISHLQLSCRRDYGLKDFWHSLGFIPTSERAGRSINQSTTLTTWVKNNPYCQNLFTTLSEIENDKICVVLDTNIVIDICQESNEESMALLQPFLSDYASFYISPIVLSEIDQSNCVEVRNLHREFAKSSFSTLTKYGQNDFEEIQAEILLKFPTKEFSNTWYDISHIAYAIASGAEAFVTRDESWLNATISDWFYQQYDLSIFSPGELVKHIDELASPVAYSPQKLIGLDISFSELQTTDFNVAAETFFAYYGDGHKATFEKTLRDWMAHPDTVRVLLVKAKNTPICLVPYSIKEFNITIFCFLFNPANIIKPSLTHTFVKRMAFKLLDSAVQAHAHCIKLPTNNLPSNVEDAFITCGYIKVADTLLKILDARIMAANELSIVKELPVTAPLNVAITTALASNSLQIQNIVEIEKALWPLKTLSPIPCYIVPIKADYAMELFDEALSNANPSLFNNTKIAPALNIENVYFKSSRKSIPSAPARILWYVSRSNQIGTGAIRACSYLDSVEVADVKYLFKKYQRLCVLDWTKLSSMCDGNHCVAAYRFRYTESFSQPVTLNEVRTIIGKRSATFQSFTAITTEEYSEIYKRGTGRE